MEKVVIASGYFNPLHEGHIEYLEKASKLGWDLFVIINNDKQVKLKGKPFMNEEERARIINALECVDRAVISIDTDKSVSKTIEVIHQLFHYGNTEFILANGGDVFNKNCLEKETCKKLGIRMVHKLGEKIQSSSKLK